MLGKAFSSISVLKIRRKANNQRLYLNVEEKNKQKVSQIEASASRGFVDHPSPWQRSGPHLCLQETSGTETIVGIKAASTETSLTLSSKDPCKPNKAPV